MRGDLTMLHEYKMSNEEFVYLCQLATDLTGIHIDEHKKVFICNRLMKRLRALELEDFKAYCKLLKANLEEQIFFINAITTTVTSFFRENHHFEYLKNIFLPQLISVQQASKQLRIWSAGCSTGEEAYSIAIAVSEMPSLDSWNIKILATDINEDALAIAKAGVYPKSSIENIESERKKRWFLNGIGKQEGYVLIKPELKQLITFKKYNLIGEWPPLDRFQIIFCRNVIIYFSKETQRILIERFANLLDSDGILVIGHSESLFKVSNRFNLIENNVYEKMSCLM